MTHELTPEDDLRSGDEADKANVQAEQNLQIALRRARSQPTLAAIGRCHWCDEPVDPGLRFCVPDAIDPLDWACAREYERNRKALARNLTVPEPDETLDDPREILIQLMVEGKL